MQVLVPSRERPQQVLEMLDAIRVTSTLPDLSITVGVCTDDPRLDEYRTLWRTSEHIFSLSVMKPPEGGHRGFVYPLNLLARHAAAEHDEAETWMVLGDDHRPRTHGWDERLYVSLSAAPVSFAYGNDLIHGERLPTACAMSSAVFRALGYIAPPTLGHLFVDNTWKAWGERTKITYHPDVIIEHMHPLAGKAQDDATYRQQDWTADTAAWTAYSNGLDRAANLAVDLALLERFNRVRGYPPHGAETETDE